MYGTAGYCVPPMHREGLAKAMNEMCKDRNRRLEMGEVGRLRVEKFFRHKLMMERYIALYNEV